MANENKSLAKRSKYLLLFGFLLFINPTPLGLDLLPDALGCILIYFGLAQLAYFNGSAEKAQKLVFYMLITEGIKLFLTKSIFLTEIASNRMLGIVVFSLLEIPLYIFFFKQFFEGVSYFSMRNNGNKTLAKCDGSAFLSYLSVTIRIISALAPELLALVEQRKHFTTDFKTIDLINDIMVAKPLLVVLLSLLALITGIAWYISIFGLVKGFYSELGETLDLGYNSEYTSKPRLTRQNKLKRVTFWLYIGLFCLVDISVDKIPIAPPWATFGVLFVVAFVLSEYCNFGGVKKWSMPALILVLGAEIFKRVFVPYGAVVIYETKLGIVIANAAIAIITATVCMLCIRHFLLSLSALSESLGGEPVATFLPWVAFCLSQIFWAIGYTVPYLYASVGFLRFACTCVFIWKTASAITQIYDEEVYRTSLYGDDVKE